MLDLALLSIEIFLLDLAKTTVIFQTGLSKNTI
jgi:hypothetical protein